MNIRIANTLAVGLVALALSACTSETSNDGEETAGAITGEQCSTKEFKGGDESDDVALLTNVRTGVHTEGGGYDRLVFEFDGAKVPKYVVTKQNETTFWGPGEGDGAKVEVRGDAGLNVWFPRASAFDMHAGKPSFEPKRIPLSGGKGLLEAAEVEDFESNLVWGAGIAKDACVRVTTLTNPPRLVIDVSRP